MSGRVLQPVHACRACRTKAAGGQALVETALVLPLLLILALGVFTVGVVGRTDAAVLAVAQEAARAAATSTDAATAAAHGVARGTQVAAGYRLQGTIVTVDARDFRAGGRVQAEATVTIPLGAFPLVGPAAITLHHRHAEPVDPFRNVR